MAAPHWIAEAPEEHLLPHLRSFVDRQGSPWRLVSAEASTGGQVSRGRLRAEAFALIGSVAELSTYVQERRTDHWVEYEVVTGILTSDSGWQGHGHVLVVRIEEMPAEV
jgi:hypothetical protein